MEPIKHHHRTRNFTLLLEVKPYADKFRYLWRYSITIGSRQLHGASPDDVPLFETPRTAEIVGFTTVCQHRAENHTWSAPSMRPAYEDMAFFRNQCLNNGVHPEAFGL